MGRSRGQGPWADTSRTQGRVYSIVPQTEPVEKSVIQSMFLLSRIWAKILFDYGASHSFFAASCVEELGLEVETLEKSLYVSSPLRTRVSVQQICHNCELDIFGILLTVDLRVRDMTEFDVILGMEWFTASSIVIVGELLHPHEMEYVLCFRGISTMIYPRLCTTPGSTDS